MLLKTLKLLSCKTSIILGLSNPSIGFSPFLSHDAHLGKNETIKYENVLTNSGNGYHKWCGHFVAPRWGLYVFSCSVRATNTNEITVELIQNGQCFLKISSAKTPGESGSSTVVVKMDKGYRVWVKLLAHDRQITRDYKSFSEYLVSSET